MAIPTIVFGGPDGGCNNCGPIAERILTTFPKPERREAIELFEWLKRQDENYLVFLDIVQHPCDHMENLTCHTLSNDSVEKLVASALTEKQRWQSNLINIGIAVGTAVAAVAGLWGAYIGIEQPDVWKL